MQVEASVETVAMPRFHILARSRSLPNAEASSVEDCGPESLNFAFVASDDGLAQLAGAARTTVYRGAVLREVSDDFAFLNSQ
jgi:hypothetical protein